MKITLITGAASGLGKEFSILFAKDNTNLLLIDINMDGLKKTKEEIEKINNSILIDLLEVDLSDLSSYKKVYDYTIKQNYFINNLINCAGFGDRRDFNDMNIDKQITMTNVDCNAILYFTKVFLGEMLKQNEGQIIHVSSIAGFMPGPYMCTYHACKGYVLLLGEAISYELRKTNVKLLTLCPGPFLSDFVHKAHNDYTFEKIKPISAKSVATYGYKQLKKGKRLAIVGFKNKLTIFAIRFFPRSLVTLVSAKNIKKTNE